MAETKCRWCKRFVSKHDNLALRICLLKAIRDKEIVSPSPKEIKPKSNGLEKLDDIEKPKEKKYKAHDVFGDYEADVTVYANGMSKTYLSSRKKGYIDR